MRSALAIARAALTTAVRSRVVMALAVALTAVLIALPLTLRSDGSAEGQAQITLLYSLGAAALLLNFATLWAGCATLAGDIESKRLQLVAIKPVARFSIWLGKWLALLLINTGLVALTGLLVYLLLMSRLDGGARESALRQTILAARVSAQPRRPDVAAAARTRMTELRRLGQLPADMRPEIIQRSIENELRLQAHAVPPGEEKTWTLPLPPQLQPGTFLLLYRFVVSRPDQPSVQGRWTITEPSGTQRSFPVTLDQGRFQMSFPLAHPANWLNLTFRNAGGSAVFFNPTDGIELLAPAGAFEGNYLRALLILWIELAFAAALGVTAGTFFSMPVAVLCALFVTLLSFLGPYVRSQAADNLPSGEEARLTRWLRPAYSVMAKAVRPLESPPWLGPLSGGLRIPWSSVAAGLAGKVGLGGLLCGALGAAALRRRELALPES